VQLRNFYEQLKQRRVIRAAIIYAALLWALLQVADLLAGANMISDAMVRWMIVVGVVGFPLTLIGSWFLESPWKERRWTAVAGDLLVMIAIAVAALVFLWQQWMQSFTRPVVAVLSIEATDTRDDTADLAAHLTKRLRMLLATQIEVKVIENSSSTHPTLATKSLAEKTALLDAEYVLTGTLSRGGDDIRFSMQLYDRDGELIWGERFEDRLIDQVQLQNRVLTELWPNLPIDDDALAGTKQIVADCDYPTDGDAILALARDENDRAEEGTLMTYIESNEDDGLLFLQQARRQFAAISNMPPPRRPVAQQLAMQNLAAANEQCPGHPDVGLLRLENTRTVEEEGLAAAKHLAKHPNASSLYIKLADGLESLGADEEVVKLIAEAYTLDPLNPERFCQYRELLDSADAANSANIIAACE
jgi:TolB-like protein